VWSDRAGVAADPLPELAPYDVCAVTAPKLSRPWSARAGGAPTPTAAVSPTAELVAELDVSEGLPWTWSPREYVDAAPAAEDWP
jgi:hypothetical protein